MQRALVLACLVTACATHDVQRSEPLVARATCHGDGLAVFGYPFDQQAGCGERVVNLGDGCYFATRPGERVEAPRRPRQVLHGTGGIDAQWLPHLFECSASSPDGHVACVEDLPIGHRDDLFGEDIGRVAWRLQLPDQVGRTWPAMWLPAVARCRTKLAAWELANLPPPDHRALVATYWHVEGAGDLDRLPRERVQPAEDPISLYRILGPDPEVRATVCPTVHGIAAVIDNHYPARLEHQLATMIERALAPHPLAHCVHVEVGLAATD